ncbi:MAG: hypothetical protein CO137_03595 [Candidatus Magasanikbacteria bacterium CG_4_9_14_3_um_filter_32_9]|uniref:DoxX family protein n=1 Tax=Candidatus Magasanikbacteria bacterium CG_4_9_14_3_um_filter_32_9 TaxID=1974644 RepID=A0A2M7Z5Z5_9BACT|nr:MAG: hypothetical protein CO137_03595 [Candidatus Magasanikbacteria bacterium CG_4_9_14_3_um_filter_32_9]
MKYKKEQYLISTLRILLGSIFLWAFVDKVFGLGFSTAAENSWLSGVSPTAGFLKFGTQGLFVEIFHWMAGSILVDILFMVGLLCIGLALIFGVGMKIASYSGTLLLTLMWLAIIPPEHHPIIDEHIIYALLLILLSTTNSGEVLGMGKWWSKTKCVKKYAWLK